MKKIAICGSMSACKQMVEVEKDLVALGHKVVLPKNTKKYANGELKGEGSHESTKNKIDHDLLRTYFRDIENCDAVLVVNCDKNNIQNYIGGNTFLEMGFAHILNKPIYLLNPIPEILYTDEIKAMEPIVLEGNLENMAR